MPRFLILAGMLGLWIAFILRATRPGGIASIRFETALNITSVSLLVYSVFEETVMRGFFYAAFRNTTPFVVSVLFLVAIDAVLFHFWSLRNPRALLGIITVNVIACLFREYTKSLWPSITFNLAYHIPFAVLVWRT
jgi:membrane protease YdiL (CAAX protease family)